ncbi:MULTISPECIES: hypothetical protein [Acinetobacter]|nr:hypothetical protein [Acinetobacter radioresistens]
MENQETDSLVLSVPIDRVNTELTGIEIALIEAIQQHCEKNSISMRQLAVLTGLSVGKLTYHLGGGGDSTLFNLLNIAQKIGLEGSITLHLKPKAEQ